MTIEVTSLRSLLELTSAELGVQHEFWHNILGEARFRYERDKFDFVNLIDNNYSMNLDGRYLISQNFEFDLTFAHNVRNANLPNVLLYNTGPYTENTVSFAIKAAI